MARRVFPLFVIGLGFLTGCVPNDKYQALKLENEQNKETARIAAAETARYKAEADAIKAQYETILEMNRAQDAKIVSLTNENSELQRTNGSLQKAYEDAMGREMAVVSVNTIALNDEQDKLLREFAAKYPDLLEYDAARGLVKFKSDVTFASGSDELKDDAARKAVKEFASLLKQPAFNTCDFFVAGHTDNTPITRPETLAKHKDNWYLSAHRAISVAHDLFTNGVSQSRVGVQGYADNRPVADNTSTTGKQKNRRVEVAILPRKGASGISTASSETAVKTTTTTTVKTVGNKDGAIIAPAPKPILPPAGLNKN